MLMLMAIFGLLADGVFELASNKNVGPNLILTAVRMYQLRPGMREEEAIGVLQLDNSLPVYGFWNVRGSITVYKIRPYHELMVSYKWDPTQEILF